MHPVVSASTAKDTLWQRVLPPLAGAALIVTFVSLGFWQLDRAEQKESLAELFANDAPHRAIRSGDTPATFEPIEIRGRFVSNKQVLIDNIVRAGRVGYFVVTPLETGLDDRVLLVNRGWVAKSSQSGPPDADLSVPAEWRPIRGRAGRLPRVGIRSGPAFADADGWPRKAVYPEAEEVAAALDQEVWPFVLLLSPEDPQGFRREWQPEQSGPMTHYGYAFQWFAMAVAVAVIGGWHLRKRVLAR